MSAKFPGEIELHGRFRQHLGPRFTAAGLAIQFHWNQQPGLHFRVPVDAAYESEIARGLREGLAERFPEFPPTASIWITEISASDSDSSPEAFYRAARMLIEQAFFLTNGPAR